MVYGTMNAEGDPADRHGYRIRLSSALKSLHNESFPKEDKELIERYAHHMSAQGLGYSRKAKVVFALVVLRRMLRVPFEAAVRRKL